MDAECFGEVIPGNIREGRESEIRKERKPIKCCYQASDHCVHLESCPAGEP